MIHESRLLVQGTMEADKVPFFPMQVDEVHHAFVFQAVKLLLADVPHQLPKLFQCLCPIPRVLGGQAANALFLAQQAIPQHLGKVRPLQPGTDSTESTFQISCFPTPKDVLRQRCTLSTNNAINIHVFPS